MQTGRVKKAYLLEVRDAVVFTLVDKFEINPSDVADMMGLNKSTVSRILKSEKPSGRLIKSLIKTISNI